MSHKRTYLDGTPVKDELPEIKLPIIEAGGTKVVGESLIMDWPDIKRGVEQVLYNVLSEMVDRDDCLIKNKNVKVSCYRIRPQNLIRIDIRDVG